MHLILLYRSNPCKLINLTREQWSISLRLPDQYLRLRSTHNPPTSYQTKLFYTQIPCLEYCHHLCNSDQHLHASRTVVSADWRSESWVCRFPVLPVFISRNGIVCDLFLGWHRVTNGPRLLLCRIYYYVWIEIIPKLEKYEFRLTVVDFDDGSVAHKLVKVPNVELAL